MRRARFILPFKLCAKTFVYTETDDVIGTVTPFGCIFDDLLSKRYGAVKEVRDNALPTYSAVVTFVFEVMCQTSNATYTPSS